MQTYKQAIVLAFFLGIIVTPSNGQDQFYDFVGTDVLSGVPVASESRYRCSFTNLWSEEAHPNLFPADTATWSDQLFITHASRFSIWEPGSVASDGMAQLAMSRNALGVTVEVLGQESAVTDVEVGPSFVVAGGSMQERQLGEFRILADTPFLTTIAAMSPSPDWFTGVSAFDLRQDTGIPETPQMWYRGFQIETYPFTAGTMTGETYSDSGTAIDPAEPIRQFSIISPPVSTTGVYANPAGNGINPVSRWYCSLVNAVPLDQAPTSPPSFGISDGISDGTVILSGMEETVAPSMNSTIMSSMDTTMTETMDEDTARAVFWP